MTCSPFWKTKQPNIWFVNVTYALFTQIKYRGLTIPEVVTLLPRQGKSPSAEAVFWLLLTGDVPTQEQTASLIADWTTRRQKRKDWWSGPGGGIVGSVLRTLPKTTTPLGRLSIALAVFDSSKHTKDALRDRASSHTHWEVSRETIRLTLSFAISCETKEIGSNVRTTDGSSPRSYVWVNFLKNIEKKPTYSVFGTKV